MNIISKSGGLLVMAALATGCAPTTPPLYQWDSYQPTIYSYYQGDTANLAEQVQVLEASVAKASAGGVSVPPGLHAHLGMLYFNTGREQDAHAQFLAEKALFPESTSFIDYILNAQKDQP